MVGEHRPGFELPSILIADFEETAVQNFEALCATEAVLFLVGARRDEVGAVLRELVCRRVRPRYSVVSHVWYVCLSESPIQAQAFGANKSGDTSPHSKALRADFRRQLPARSALECAPIAALFFVFVPFCLRIESDSPAEMRSRLPLGISVIYFPSPEHPCSLRVLQWEYR